MTSWVFFAFFSSSKKAERMIFLEEVFLKGFFLVWLRDNKDPDFLKKFNASTLEVIPWSFDGAIRHCLGENANIDELWHEYQVAVGDIKL